ncbi:hypothetical protein QBC40DRAFT_174646 [Triangularia verruculosa]|uniref:RRM domain-containing protein n=1 Tax=Triangularia verruculosa TaxID=2587418 RepID=A0AAN6XH62_9PEZI|nr:hypothetical protein QBC40DRAFT_174646 [Triangularia verruculosa]
MTWLSNNRAGRHRTSRDPNLANFGDGYGPGSSQLSQQYGQQHYGPEVYRGPTVYSGYQPLQSMMHPVFHSSYSAPDHISLSGHSHAHGTYHPQQDPYRRPATPYAPSPLGLSGQFGLRPDAIPFDPSSPLLPPSPSHALGDPTSLNHGAPCYYDCGDDCPFADPYRPGWLERKAKDKDTDENTAPASSPGLTALPPDWLERMAKERASRQNMTNTPQASPPSSPWSRAQPMSHIGGDLRAPRNFGNIADGQSPTISRASTSTLRDQFTPASRTPTHGSRGPRAVAGCPPNPGAYAQYVTGRPTTNMASVRGNPHIFYMQDPNAGSVLPLHQLLETSKGASYEDLEKLRQAIKRVENARNISELAYSPCSSSNNSQQSSWSLEDLADDIQPEESCSVFISGLPKDVTLSQLLGSIRCGRVRYSKIAGSEALVVFFEKNAAQRFARQGQLDVAEVQAKVQLAKMRVAESTLPRSVSRVLVISGFVRALSIPFLKDCLEMKNVRCELEKIVRGTQGDMSTLEWHFASYAQARKVQDVIMTEPLLCKKGVRARFGIDPCAGSDTGTLRL